MLPNQEEKEKPNANMRSVLQDNTIGIFVSFISHQLKDIKLQWRKNKRIVIHAHIEVISGKLGPKKICHWRRNGTCADIPVGKAKYRTFQKEQQRSQQARF